MTRVHDMGGRWGDGPVDTSDHGVFAEDWHARALGLVIAAGGLGRWSIDASRHARESLAPADYTRFSYYEKWLAGLADLLVAKDLVSREELGGGPAAPTGIEPFRADRVAAALARVSPYTRDGPAPAFAPGDAVRTRLPARNVLVPGGHTRLPFYAAGHLGRVVAFRGCHVLPDANAHGLGEAPEPLYTVAFAAAELWGEAEAPGDEVMADLWESYLEPAGGAGMTLEGLDGGPFDEPWHAELLALTVALSEAGHYSWADWSEALGAELARRGAGDGGAAYHAAWLAALERLLAERGLADPVQVEATRAAWEAAYLATPHGRPVRLAGD